MSTEPCRCEAYPFPHRHYGGECRARYELERDAAEAAVDHRWLAKLHSED